MVRLGGHLRKLWSVFVFVFLFNPIGARADGPAAVLPNPSGEDLVFLAYNLAGAPEPFDAWAQADPSVQSLDEFHQGPAAQALSAQMHGRSDRIKNMRLITVEVNSEFGDYNTAYGEFDLDINDGTTIPFNTTIAPRGGVVINLTNGGVAQSWTISPENAAKMLALVKDNRYVVLTMTLQLTDATLPTSDYNPVSIDATVLKYDITSMSNNLRLGHVDVSQ